MISRTYTIQEAVEALVPEECGRAAIVKIFENGFYFRVEDLFRYLLEGAFTQEYFSMQASRPIQVSDQEIVGLFKKLKKAMDDVAEQEEKEAFRKFVRALVECVTPFLFEAVRTPIGWDALSDKEKEVLEGLAYRIFSEKKVVESWGVLKLPAAGEELPLSFKFLVIWARRQGNFPEWYQKFFEEAEKSS